MWARVSDASHQNLLCRTLAARWRQGARATNGGIAEKLTHGVPTASTSGKKGQKSMCKVETRMSTPKVALALQTHSEKEKEKMAYHNSQMFFSLNSICVLDGIPSQSKST